MDNNFYKVPNQWIREKSPNIKRICLYYLLNKLGCGYGTGMISMRYIIENCGYVCRKGISGVNGKYIQLFSSALEKQDISLDEGYAFPPCNLNSGIAYLLNAFNFDNVDKFTKLNDTEFDKIIRCNKNKNKETALSVYLYVKSYYHPSASLNRPFGFYQRLTSIESNLGISEASLIKILDWLVSNNLLIKYYVGSHYIDSKNKTKQNVPNIYIPNLGQSQDEIDDIIRSTVKVMKEFYGVKHFMPFMKNLKEN